MVRGGQSQLRAISLEQRSPKVRCEFGVPIGDDDSRDSMKPDNRIEKALSGIISSVSALSGHEVTPLGQLVYDEHDHIPFSFAGRYEWPREVHGQGVPSVRRNI